jgi:hypothetical protein
VTRFPFYDDEIVDIAFLAMLKQILSRGDSTLHLIDAIAQIDPQDIVLVFSGVIRLWLECMQTQINTQFTYGGNLLIGLWGNERETPLDAPTFSMDVDQNFHDREKKRLLGGASNKSTATYNILKFAATAAHRHNSIQSCMLDAGALSLVVTAFINVDFLASSLINFRWEGGKVSRPKPKHAMNINADAHTPIPSDVILDEAATLSTLIHTPSFRHNWDERHFNNRRHLSLLLVDSLLGSNWAKDDNYRWTRAVFRKILA